MRIAPVHIVIAVRLVTIAEFMRPSWAPRAARVVRLERPPA